ncbi:SIMPL domain-containing protein [Halonotius pteroides]|uniref:SIMPL domain-containing protein n=1 Tax=Halonotius pteroides TaxID=268735 RepID=UPI0014037421|nr:SIMPL domain-containing protein [Halonotius pteroides]
MTGTVTATASATRAAAPDSATVAVTALGEAASAARARKRARNRAATVRTAIEATVEVGIETVDHRVTNSAVTFEPETDAAFRAVEEFHVRCEPDAVATVVVEATDGGGGVDHVQFALTDTARADLQAEAMTAAVDRARRKADRLAAADGLAVGAARSITTQPARPGNEPVDDAWESDPSVHPAPISVTERVEVEYELTAAETDMTVANDSGKG